MGELTNTFRAARAGEELNSTAGPLLRIAHSLGRGALQRDRAEIEAWEAQGMADFERAIEASAGMNTPAMRIIAVANAIRRPEVASLSRMTIGGKDPRAEWSVRLTTFPNRSPYPDNTFVRSLGTLQVDTGPNLRQTEVDNIGITTTIPINYKTGDHTGAPSCRISVNDRTLELSTAQMYEPYKPGDSFTGGVYMEIDKSGGLSDLGLTLRAMSGYTKFSPLGVTTNLPEFFEQVQTGIDQTVAEPFTY